MPVAAIITDSFIPTADAMAALRGAPGYKYATTAHPVAVLTEDKVKERAAQVLDDVVALLTDDHRRKNEHDGSRTEGSAAWRRRRPPTPTRRSARSSTATTRAGPTGCRWSRCPGRCSTRSSPPPDKDPDEIIGSLEQVGRDVDVRTAAINAAMAGCKPEYFPVVLAAFEALMRERAARGGGFQSTSGPVAADRGQRPGQEGARLQHRRRRVRARVPAERDDPARGRPHRPQRVRHPPARPRAGHPGRARPLAICIAENEEESPWEPFAENGGVAGGVSAVSATLTRTMEFVDNRHTPDHEDVLRDIQDTINRIGSLIFPQTSVALVLCPEHAQMFAAAGLSKADVQNWMIERSGRTGREFQLAWARRASATRRSDGTVRGRRRVPPHPVRPPADPGHRRRREERRHLHGGADLRRVVRYSSPGSGEEMNYSERMADIAAMLAADGYQPGGRGAGSRLALTDHRRARTPARTAWCPRTCCAASPSQQLGIDGGMIDITYPVDLPGYSGSAGAH